MHDFDKALKAFDKLYARGVLSGSDDGEFARRLAADEIDHDAARQLLAILDPEAETFNFQTFADQKGARVRADATGAEIHRAQQGEIVKSRQRTVAMQRRGSFADLADRLDKLNKAGGGVFVTVNAMKGETRGNDQVERYRAVWADMDAKSCANTTPTWPLQPSIEVQTSPGNRQFWWLLEDDISPTEWRRVMAGISGGFGADANAIDPARVLRLPGYFHMKSEPTRSVLMAIPGHRYTAKQLIEAFGKFVAVAPRAASRVAIDVDPVSGRVEQAINGDKHGGDVLGELDDALAHVPVDIGEGQSRFHWLRVGAALFHVSGGADTGQQVWHKWSKKSKDYDAAEIDDMWPTFERERLEVDMDNGETRPNNAGAGTIRRLAEHYGWKRPARNLMQPMPQKASIPTLPPEPSAAEAAVSKAYGDDKDVLIIGGVVVRKPSFNRVESIEWLVPGMLMNGTLNVIFGHSNVGKSTFLSDLAARVSSGRLMPWEATGKQCSLVCAPDELGPVGRVPGSVIWLNGEEHTYASILPRYRAAGGIEGKLLELEAVPIVGREGKVQLGTVNLQRDVDKLDAVIGGTGDTRLIIIDPLSNYLAGTDANSGSEMRALLMPLTQLAERRRVCVLVVAHTRKNSEGSASDRLAGSGAVQQSARMVNVIGYHPDFVDQPNPMRVVTPCKSNEVRDPQSFGYFIEGAHVHKADGAAVETKKSRWHGPVAFVDPDAVLNAKPGMARKDGEKGNGREAAMAWLFKVMKPDVPMKTSELIEMGTNRSPFGFENFTKRTLERAMSDLGVQSAGKEKGKMAGQFLVVLPQAAYQAYRNEREGRQREQEAGAPDVSSSL